MTTEELALDEGGPTLRLSVTAAAAPSTLSVVCVHGGPGGDRHGPSGIFDLLAARLSKSGCNVVQYDGFGAGGSDGAPEQITLKTQLQDLARVESYVSSRFPNPIVICGESMGATIATLQHSRLAVAHVLLWPAFDLADTDLRPYLSAAWHETAVREGVVRDGGVVIGLEFLNEIVNTDFGRCFELPRTPTLLMHGRLDRSVPFLQSVKAMQCSAGAVTLISHPTADHGFQEPQQQSAVCDEVEAWLCRFASTLK